MADKLKGNLVVGQSGGPTAVINSSLAGVVEEAKKYSHISEIYGMLYGIEGVLNEDLVDLRKESESTIRGLTSTPSSALGSCRHKLDPEDYARILNTLRPTISATFSTLVAMTRWIPVTEYLRYPKRKGTNYG